jgi:uncharacterized protein (DUF4415 family)
MSDSSTNKPSRTRWQQVDRLRDADIDTSDTPALRADFFRAAQLRMPQPKASITIRLDREVIDWFKSQGNGYQTRMNAVLRLFMESKTG